jgi:hypothetical protein
MRQEWLQAVGFGLSERRTTRLRHEARVKLISFVFAPLRGMGVRVKCQQPIFTLTIMPSPRSGTKRNKNILTRRRGGLVKANS